MSIMNMIIDRVTASIKKYMQENELPPLHMKYPETKII